MGILALAFTLLAAAGAAWADDAKEQAKQHFMAGEQKFKAGDYQGAIAEFEAADALVPSPILSYNIGLAHEKLGQDEQAVAKYQDYLVRRPDAPNRAQVEARISGLQQKIAAAKAPPAPQPVAPTPTPTPEPKPRTPDLDQPDQPAQPQSPKLGPGSKGWVDPDPNHPQQPVPAAPQPVDPAVNPPDGATQPPAPIDPLLAKRLPDRKQQVAQVGPGDAPTQQPKGPAEAAPVVPSEKKSKAKPVYKEWWFWVVVGVSTYIVVDMFSHSSSPMTQADQPPTGAVLFRF